MNDSKDPKIRILKEILELHERVGRFRCFFIGLIMPEMWHILGKLGDLSRICETDQPAKDLIEIHSEFAKVRTSRADLFAALIQCRDALQPIADPDVKRLTADGTLDVLNAYDRALKLTMPVMVAPKEKR